jgi:hypothetical protein
VCAILGALRDRGQTKRNKPRKTVALMLTAWNMQRISQRAWHCVPSAALRSESWDKHFVATRYGGRRGGGEAPCSLRWDQCQFTCSTAHDASGVFDEELHLGARWTAGVVTRPVLVSDIERIG